MLEMKACKTVWFMWHKILKAMVDWDVQMRATGRRVIA